VINPRNRPRADLSVAVSRGPYRYGKKATVTVTLHHHRSNAQLRIYAATPDGKLYYLKHGKPDSHGQLHLRLTMSVNTTFIGTFDGDSSRAARGVGHRVRVAAWVVGKLFDAKGHAGRYSLYKPTQKAVFGTAVGPNKKRQCIYFRAQFHIRGHWGYPATTSCVTLNKQSGAAASLQGTRTLAGIPIRIRSEWYGDSFNKRARSTWHYFKFTGAARSAVARTGSTYGTLHPASAGQAAGSPKIRTPFSQQTARNHWSPSSNRPNPLSWLS